MRHGSARLDPERGIDKGTPVVEFRNERRD